jgi:hypothetical protein
MKKYLVIFNDLYNDEVEVNGFMVMTEKEVDYYEDLVYTISWDFQVDFNDIQLTYNSGEDLLSKIDFKEISNEQYKMFEKLFENGFGYVVKLETIETIADGEDVEYEDLDEDFDEDLEDDEYYFKGKNNGLKYDDDYDNDDY